MGKVEEAIQEHAKKIQLMEEEVAKIKLERFQNELQEGGSRLKAHLRERYKEQWSPSFIALNGWVDWYKKMETM